MGVHRGTPPIGLPNGCEPQRSPISSWDPADSSACGPTCMAQRIVQGMPIWERMEEGQIRWACGGWGQGPINRRGPTVKPGTSRVEGADDLVCTYNHI